MNLLTLVKYNSWANKHYIKYCYELSNKDLNREFTGYTGNIKKILFHLYEVYWYWFTFITDQNYSDEPDWDNLTIKELLNGIQDFDNKIIKYIDKNDIAKEFIIQRDDSHKPVSTSSENIIFNFVSHGSYHRGQLAIFLRNTGLNNIKETDFNPYIYEMGQREGND